MPLKCISEDTGESGNSYMAEISLLVWADVTGVEASTGIGGFHWKAP